MKDTYTLFFILGGICIVIIIIIGVFYLMSANDTLQNQRKKKGYLSLLSNVSMFLAPLAAVFIFIGVYRIKTQKDNIKTVKDIIANKEAKRIVAKRVVADAKNGGNGNSNNNSNNGNSNGNSNSNNSNKNKP
jgi:predicted membrane protein